jgi:hypothetical protein
VSELKPKTDGIIDALQEFEGTVLELTADSIVARLMDRTNPGLEEEAEIPLAEVRFEERELVRPGAVFRWAIGDQQGTDGRRTRVSTIRFQRLPSWTCREVGEAKKAAGVFLESLDLDRAKWPS